MKYIHYALIGILIFSCGCQKKDPETSVSKPLNGLQKQANELHKYGQLIASLLDDGIVESDIRQHIYLLRAGFWELNLQLESAQTAAILKETSSKLLIQENQFSLQTQSFVDIQNYYIKGNLDSASDLLSKNQDIPNRFPDLEFSYKALEYLISNKLLLSELLKPDNFESFIGYCREILTNLDMDRGYRALVSEDLLDVSVITEYPFATYTFEQYECGTESCTWPIEELLAYSFTAGRLAQILLPFCGRSFPAAKMNEQLLYNIYSSLILNQLDTGVGSLETVMRQIEAADLHTKSPFQIPYEIGFSRMTKNTISDKNFPKEHPLAYVLLLNNNLEKSGSISQSYADEVLENVFPVLIDKEYAISYRDLLYEKLWFYLWNKDLTVLEKFRIKKGVSLEINTPEYFLSLLPYWSEHIQESGLGMQRLKTSQSDFQYLRPLISSYEYIQAYHSKDGNGQARFQ